MNGDEDMKRRARELVASAYDKIRNEQKIQRLASMPDVLERYDQLMTRIGRLSLIADWLANEIMSARHGEYAYPDRLTSAVAFLCREIEETQSEQNRDSEEVAAYE